MPFNFKTTTHSRKRSAVLGLFSLVLVIVLVAVIFPPQVFGVAKTWSGGGADNNWSTAANWTPSGAPASADTITFNGTSTKNATIDASFAGTVASLTIASGYTGTIDAARSFTVTGGFSQATGTFTGAAQTVSFGSFTQTGGVFTASSTTTTISGGVTITAGTFNHNSGTVVFSGSTATLSCNSVSFNLVSFSGQTGVKTINSNCSLPLGASPTVPNGLTVNGTVSGSGTITFTTGTLNLATGSTFSGFTGANIKSFILGNGVTADFSAYSPFTFAGTLEVDGGTLTFPNVAIGITSFVNNIGGTINMSSATTTVSGGFGVNTAATTFNANGGTVNFTGGAAAIGCNGIYTFNLVTFTGQTGTKTITNCTLPLGNNPTVPNSLSISTSTTLTGSGTMTMTTGTLQYSAATASLSGFSGLSVPAINAVGVSINYSSYTSVSLGTVSIQTSGTLTMPTSGSSTMTSLSMTGATVLSASPGTTTITGALNMSGTSSITANGGTINFSGSTATLTCNNATFNLVTFTGQTGVKTVSSNCNLPLGSNATIPNGITLSGTLSGSGTVAMTTGTLTLSSGAVLSGFSGANWSSVTNAITMDFSSYSPFSITGALSHSAGTLTLANAGTYNITTLTLTGGTLNNPSGTMNVSSTLSITGSPVFNANGGTYDFSGGAAVLGCNNVTFSSVSFAGQTGAKTVSANCSLPLGSNPTIPNGISLSGTLSGTGTITETTGTLTINSTGSLSGFTGLTGTTNGLTISGATANFGSYSTFLIGGAFNVSTGTITMPSGTATFGGAFTISSGTTFNVNGNSMIFTGSGVSLSCNSVTFNSATLSNTGTLTIAANCTLPLGNNPTVANSLNLSGVLTGTGTYNMTTGTLSYSGTGASLSGFSAFNGSALTISAIVNVNFGSYSSFTASGTVTNANTSTLTLPGGSTLGALTVSASGAVVAAVSGNMTVNGNVTQTNGTLNPPTGTFTVHGNIAHSGGTFATTAGNIVVDGNLTAGNTTFNAPSGNLSIGGTFNHTAGTFNHNSGTVILNGTGATQTISGIATTFNNLTKQLTSASAQTLTFPASVTETVLGTLTLGGYDATNRLSLRSSSNGTQWRIDPQATRTVQYLDIKDGNNVNGAVFVVGGTGSVDSNNNTNFDFSSPPNTPTSLGPSQVVTGVTTVSNQPTFTFTLTDDNVLDTVRYQIEISTFSDFSVNTVDYTSALQTQGGASFTIGQSGGTYLDGSIGQFLDPGNYYWRVRAFDNGGLNSAWATANGGSIAFIVAGEEVTSLPGDQLDAAYYTKTVLKQDGNPLLLYYNLSTTGGSDSISVVSCNNVACNDFVSTLNPGNSGGKAGAWGLLYVRSTGNPVYISRDTQLQGTLSTLDCANPACTTATLHQQVFPRTGGWYGVVSGAKRPNGLPFMAMDGTSGMNGILDSFSCATENCTSGTRRTLDANGAGANPSVAALADNRPVVSYYDKTNYSLKLYVCANAACTTGTATTLHAGSIDQKFGEISNVVIRDDGTPGIAYSGPDGLYFYDCANANCTGGSVSTNSYKVHDEEGSMTGNYGGTMIQIDSNSNPVILSKAARRKGSTTVSIYKCYDPRCSEGRFRTLVSDNNSNGAYAALLIRGDGGYVIPYKNRSNNTAAVYSSNPANTSTIVNLDGALEVKQLSRQNTLESQTNTLADPQTQNFATAVVDVRLQTAGGVPLSDVTVTFADNANMDWTNVNGASDLINGKAVIHDLETTSGNDATHVLYVPKRTQDESVRICPSATALVDVTTSCAGGYSLNANNSGVTIVNVDGDYYWRVEGLTGTGGIGVPTSNGSIGLTLTPNSVNVSSTSEIVAHWTPSSEFVSTETAAVDFPIGFTVADTCAVPTVDADGDTTTDGVASITTSPDGNPRYLYTFSATTTTAALTGLDFCINVTVPASSGNYQVDAYDYLGGFGSAFLYVGNENKMMITAMVDNVLSFTIRNSADTADLSNVGNLSFGPNLCDLGNLTTAGVQSCAYRLKIATNALNGYTVSIATDGSLRNSTDTAFIPNITVGTPVTNGAAGYGISLNAGHATEDPLTGIIEGTNFDTDDSPTATAVTTGISDTLFTCSVPNNPGSTDTYYTALVTHNAESDSGTSAGNYSQLVTYTVSASF